MNFKTLGQKFFTDKVKLYNKSTNLYVGHCYYYCVKHY